ncbi:MAG: AraC family transcriptional regulator [Brevundimonas sp.]|nr:MAG: AraC family transcriptional regulator [Brevundimonas sp.]
MANELTTAIAAIMDAQGIDNGAWQTPVPGLHVLRVHASIPPRHMTYRPSLCIVAQGAKSVLVGDQTLEYGAMQSLVVTVEVPVLGHIVKGSPEEPFVGATLQLDADILLDVVTRLDASATPPGRPGFGLVVKDMDAQITSALLRLLDTIGRPGAVDILYPAIMREIAYWLLTGPAGANVARMVLPEGQPQKIARAIHHLRTHYDAPLSVATLAEVAGMSPSSFHQHFRALTSMSPLQYQKHLRLLEARRLMVGENERVGPAAFSVGYESVSQFSREYARMFGAPPRRETARARAALTAAPVDEAGLEMAG